MKVKSVDNCQHIHQISNLFIDDILEIRSDFSNKI